MSGASIDLVSAYTALVTRHERGEYETVSGLQVPKPGSLEAWFQKVLADALFEKGLLVYEDVVLASVYVADLLTSQRGMSFRAIAPRHNKAFALELADFVGMAHHPVRMLMLGERAFVHYCYMPEKGMNKSLTRDYVRDMGIRAYRTYEGVIGKRMETAFVPLGDIVRDKFQPPS